MWYVFSRLESQPTEFDWNAGSCHIRNWPLQPVVTGGTSKPLWYAALASRVVQECAVSKFSSGRVLSVS